MQTADRGAYVSQSQDVLSWDEEKSGGKGAPGFSWHASPLVVSLILCGGHLCHTAFGLGRTFLACKYRSYHLLSAMRTPTRPVTNALESKNNQFPCAAD